MEVNTTEMATNIVTHAMKSGINVLVSKLKEFIKDMDEKTEINFGDAYEKYLINAEKRIRLVKTLIYNKEPHDIYTIYENINVNYEGNEISTENVNNILSIGHKIIITGIAGMGKTTMLKHLFVNTIQKTSYIPVFVELRVVNSEDVKDINILELIYKGLVNYGFKVDYKYFEYSMSIGKYIIFYDGLDEVKSEKSFILGKRIKEISIMYSDNYYILSSRPSDQFIGWNDFNELETMILTKPQAINLIDHLEYDQIVKQKFMEALENGLFEKYSSFASNPLLLNIMLMTFDEGATIPDKLNDFYEQAFSTLFNVHDGSKDCFKRNISTGLGCEDFKFIFAYFCFKTYFNNVYEFTDNSVRKYISDAKKVSQVNNWRVDDYLDDLVKAVCMLVKDGLNYTFAHRSFQEYFAAWYTTKLEDSIQVRLLNGWLNEKKGYADDPYFLMLYNLQSEKFNKIFLCPGIKEIKKYYEKGFGIDFLGNLFSGVVIRCLNIGQQKKYKTYIKIKNNYLCAILRMTCLFNGYHFENVEENNEDFISYLSKNRELREQREVSFDKIEEDGVGKIATESLNWVEKQIIFALDVLEKYNKNGVGNKRKVSSIIESL